jgi:branched-chain amino acid transport system ATP-binding protein
VTHVLDIAGLAKSFGGLTATDHVSLTVEAGEIHALIGPNGAGKSTLINQICGEIMPDAGTIHLAGRDITGLPPAARVALGLGRTFQITSLLDDMTVRQNLGLAIQAREGGNFRILDRAARRSEVWDEAAEILHSSALDGRGDVTVADLAHGERSSWSF